MGTDAKPLKQTGGVKFDGGCVRISRAWVDSWRKSGKNGMAPAMLAMGTEMNTQRTTRGNRAMTLTELLVVVCILGVVAVLLLPALLAPNRKVSRINCINNVKQIDLAFKMWSGDNDDNYPSHFAMTNDAMMKLISSGSAYVLWQTMTNELSTSKILLCPADTNRITATSFTVGFSDANISYFFGLDAEEKYPQMILLGDDNLALNGVRVRPGILNLWTNASVGWTKERHGGGGNIALTDGSAALTTVSTLQPAFVNTGFATNRLVIP